jgi:hypothetical protein
MFTFVAGAIFGLIWITWSRFGAVALRQLAGTHSGLVAQLAQTSMDDRQGTRSAFAYAPAILAGSVAAAWYQGLITIGG